MRHRGVITASQDTDTHDIQYEAYVNTLTNQFQYPKLTHCVTQLVSRALPSSGNAHVGRVRHGPRLWTRRRSRVASCESRDLDRPQTEVSHSCCAPSFSRV